MKARELHDLLKENLFFADLPEDDLMLIAGCGHNKIFMPNEVVAREGQPANSFFIVRSGKMRIDQNIPHRPPFPIQSVGKGEVLGWSWLFPPYRWTYDVTALEKTHAISLDGACLRSKCEKNHSLGYRLIKKFAGIMVQRLRATRLQVMDVYGHPEDRR